MIAQGPGKTTIIPVTDDPDQARAKQEILAQKDGTESIMNATNPSGPAAKISSIRGGLTANAIRSLAGCSSNTLSANDDGSAGPVALPFNINYFGAVFSQTFVNNNGNITFLGPLSTFTPFSLASTSTPIIAPFFADVDTRGSGSGLVQYGNTVVDGRTAFCVNYIGVGYFNRRVSPLNSFQVILIDRSDTGAENFDIEFNYNQILWETGDASGGTGGTGGSSARAGYANGTATPGTFYEIPGSAVNGGLLDGNLATGLTNNSLNSSELGRYIFPVRGGIVQQNAPPVLDPIPDQNGQWGDPIQFTATASDPDVPANNLTFSLVGAPAGATIDGVTGAFSWTPTDLQIGSHSFLVRVTDDGSPVLSDEQTVTVNVQKRATSLVYTGDGSEQYSDQQALSAVLSDAGNGQAISGADIGFALGSQGASGTTDASGTAAASLILTQDPAGIYTVETSFLGDSRYLPSSDSDPFDIVQEDARAYYNGTLFANTVCESCSTAVVTLSATIRDITVETGDPAYDPFAGDISNATVTFINRDTNAVIAANLPVNLVDPSDTSTGTVSVNWQVDLGNAASDSFTVGIIVDNYYWRNASEEDVVVTVSKPTGTNFITGGGYLVASYSNGFYPALDGTHENFGFNVKYNEGGKKLQGKVNVIFRGSGGVVYQIKGTVMQTLWTDSSDPNARRAVWSGKANLTDITDPLMPIGLGGNLTVFLEMTDRGEPGDADSIGITLWNSDGALLHSSRWMGVSTAEQTIEGGNLVVH